MNFYEMLIPVLPTLGILVPLTLKFQVLTNFSNKVI